MLLSIRLNKVMAHSMAASLYNLLGYVDRIELLHCSNPHFFNIHLNEIISLLIKTFKPRVIKISEHFIFHDTNVSGCNKQLKSTPWLYYCEQEIDIHQISLLKTEKTLLNI